MSNSNLNPIAAACGTQAAAFSDAASAEHQARDKWVKAAKAAVKAGVKLVMLSKGTEKAPNPQYDAQVVEVIRTAIVAGVSASKKSMRFSAALPGAAGAEIVGGKMHAWTVADLLALTRDQLRDIDDDVLKTQRRAFMQLVDGPMMSRLRNHVDKLENPDKPRNAKTDKTDKAVAEPNAPLLQRGKDVLNELVAGLLSMKRDDGTAMAGIVQAHEAVCEALARLGQVK